MRSPTHSLTIFDTVRSILDNLTLTSTNNQITRMIKKSLLAPVLTMCFVQIISTALITYIFPFVASCKSVLMSSLTNSLAVDECRRARGPDLCRLGRQYGFNRRCNWTSHCMSHGHSARALLNDPACSTDSTFSPPSSFRLHTSFIWCNGWPHGLLHFTLAARRSSRFDGPCTLWRIYLRHQSGRISGRGVS
jgi:hypothetical protein